MYECHSPSRFYWRANSRSRCSEKKVLNTLSNFELKSYSLRFHKK